MSHKKDARLIWVKLGLFVGYIPLLYTRSVKQTPGPGYQWESIKLTVDTTNEGQEVLASLAVLNNSWMSQRPLFYEVRKWRQPWLLECIKAGDGLTCITFEPVHAIFNNVVCATSKASDQPAPTRSLIRAFASRLSVL